MLPFLCQENLFKTSVLHSHASVKEVVLPFVKFQGCDMVLGPETQSTGEVMGIAFKFPMAFSKAQIVDKPIFYREGSRLSEVILAEEILKEKIISD